MKPPTYHAADFAFSSRTLCGQNRVLMTDDIHAISCKMCKKIIAKMEISSCTCVSYRRCALHERRDRNGENNFLSRRKNGTQNI